MSPLTLPALALFGGAALAAELVAGRFDQQSLASARAHVASRWVFGGAALAWLSTTAFDPGRVTPTFDEFALAYVTIVPIVYLTAKLPAHFDVETPDFHAKRAADTTGDRLLLASLFAPRVVVLYLLPVVAFPASPAAAVALAAGAGGLAARERGALWAGLQAVRTGAILGVVLLIGSAASASAATGVVAVALAQFLNAAAGMLGHETTGQAADDPGSLPNE